MNRFSTMFFLLISFFLILSCDNDKIAEEIIDTEEVEFEEFREPFGGTYYLLCTQQQSYPPLAPGLNYPIDTITKQCYVDFDNHPMDSLSGKITICNRTVTINRVPEPGFGALAAHMGEFTGQFFAQDSLRYYLKNNNDFILEHCRGAKL